MLISHTVPVITQVVSSYHSGLTPIMDSSKQIYRSTDKYPLPPPPPYPGPPTNHRPGHLNMSSSSSTSSSESFKNTTLNSKTLLPYNVTPPRTQGPSEAEKKIEALTKQLEDEMENNPEGELFGKFCS